MRTYNTWEMMPMWSKLSIVLIAGILVGMCLACNMRLIKSVRPDAPLEELFEDMIEHYTGVEIDVTPGSPE